jgi:cell division septum initiation protein DivIVA
MEIQLITLAIVTTISIFGNVVQFLLNKKSNDIKNLKDRIELMDSVQGKQTKYYEKEMEHQNDKIKELQKKIESQAQMLRQNGEEILRLQRMVNKLIGEGCHLEDCPNRSPYTIEEINNLTKKINNETNKKRNQGN